MEVDLKETFLDAKGNTARQPTGQIERDEDGKPLNLGGQVVPIFEPMTIGDLFIEILADNYSDQEEKWKAKLRRGKLGDRMLNSGTIDLTPGEVALILKRATTPGVLSSTLFLRVVEVLGEPEEDD